MAKILKFIRLSYPERVVFFKAACLIVLVRLGFLMFSFKSVLNLIERIKFEGSGVTDTKRIDADRIAWSVVATSRYIPFTKCLAQALVTQILFARYGYTSQLRIGVAKDGRERLKAHAWVESQGKIVIGNVQDLSRFKALPTLEAIKF